MTKDNETNDILYMAESLGGQMVAYSTGEPYIRKALLTEGVSLRNLRHVINKVQENDNVTALTINEVAIAVDAAEHLLKLAEMGE